MCLFGKMSDLLVLIWNVISKTALGSVSRSKARSQAYHAKVSQPVPGDSIGAPVQFPPEPPAAPARNPITLTEGPGASQAEGEILPSFQHEDTPTPRGEVSPKLPHTPRRQQGLC